MRRMLLLKDAPWRTAYGGGQHTCARGSGSSCYDMDT